MTPFESILARVSVPDVTDEAPTPEGVKETLEDELRQRRPLGGVVQPYLFVVLEGGRPLAGGARFSLADIDEVHIGRGDERSAQVDAGARRLMLQIPSQSLSRLHARLSRGPLGWLLEDAGSRNGSYVNGERVERELISDHDIVEVGHAFLTVRELEEPAQAPHNLDFVDLEREPDGWRTLIPSIAAGLDQVRQVARSSVGVILMGETGTGKEVLARAIHALSGRRGSFVAVNCNALPAGLVESQLFGHVKGAFSGAITDAVGFVRAADRGTLLLDEVGDLAPSGQGALLRVLQESEVIPVGRAQEQKVDVRFIATSPRPLDARPDADRFRLDLFARLAGFVHTMTPLRERREDLGLFIATLLRKNGVTESEQPRIAPDFGLALVRHDWPLNVRELQQLLARSWLLADKGLMSGAPRFVGAGNADRPASADPAQRRLSTEDRAMQERLAAALDASRGNVSQAARALGTGRIQLHRLMKRLGVDARRFRN